jgi:hypothetical protein
MSNTSYDKDVITWAQEQVKLLRSKQFEALDIEHVAEEIAFNAVLGKHQASQEASKTRIGGVTFGWMLESLLKKKPA